ncbi:filamentous hemagglutinin N-terminal domain-containing protein [Roseofilum casamattae]|uniref:Filamentous hemagglutinin N-terminal domain-containing protein n=1 Tax=Roseofilum casamattae BLCC-M143 TaxID=3022442 RepID=A0ABT7BVI4_9CYAN|nr:filamentous hemagglutinin N-terminal domain-containing protein [Roseofilum casamattae]MDJ1183204.1 filamentous hemagglutinin N-terminal domain-containing protein [Roseofilum casamattae BLCC-M143]
MVMKDTCLALSTTLATAALMLAARPNLAQVIPDGSLGTMVNGNPNFQITGGTTAGSNLFHSFQQFSIPLGGSAVFLNSPSIENIFTRVTGGSQSLINGLIEARGTANLFLINPAGITFGSGARLRLGGSFFATTADRIIFNDGIMLEASDPTEPPLLTINSPIGLDFSGNTPAPIRVEGQGHGFTLESIRTTPVDRSEANPGLEVSSGNTLALIGGEVNLVGGVLRAPEGRIALGSVQSGQMSLTSVNGGWQFGYEGVERFGDINLSERSAVDASGSGLGSIKIMGRQVRLTGGSAGLIQNTGSGAESDLTVNASEVLEVRGTDAEQTFPSLLFNETVNSGAGGQTNISTGNLLLSEGGIIHNKTYGSGDGGDLSVSAANLVEVNGFASNNPNIFSSLVAVTVNEGNSGNLTIETQDLSLLDGGNISNSTIGAGQGGNLTINASASVTLTGFIPVTLRRTVISNAGSSQGNAGTMLVNTSRLVIRDGATISTSTLAEGSAGSLTINATDSIEISGIGRTEEGELRAEILSDAPVLPAVFRQAIGLPDNPSGNAGSLTINTPRLTVSDGARVGVGNEGTGIAGNLQIEANRIEVTNEGQISAATASGGGGNIELQVADVLLLSNRGLISTEVREAGSQSQTVSANSGNITIKGNLIQLNNEGEITVRNNETGNAGDLTIQAARLELTDGGKLTATTALGQGGDIDLTVADVLLIQREGLISAGVEGENISGNAGRIAIRGNLVQLLNGGEITVRNEGTGNAGDLQLRSHRLELRDGGRLTAETASGEGGNIQLNLSDVLLLRNGGLISTEAGGTGNGGDITINAPFIFAVSGENSDIIANAFEGNGGNIEIVTNGLIGIEFRDDLTPLSDITTNSQFGVSGTVRISNPNVNPVDTDMELEAEVVDPNEEVVRGCQNFSQSRFVQTGRGGLPEYPRDRRSGSSTWHDVRDPSAYLGRTTQAPPRVEPLSLVEANAARRLPDGSMELYYAGPPTPNRLPQLAQSNCSS